MESAQIGRVRWDRTTGQIWYATVAQGERVRLFRVDPSGGTPTEQENILPSQTAAPGEFDLAADGRILAVTRCETRGDIWLLEAAKGTY